MTRGSTSTLQLKHLFKKCVQFFCCKFWSVQDLCNLSNNTPLNPVPHWQRFQYDHWRPFKPHFATTPFRRFATSVKSSLFSPGIQLKSLSKPQSFPDETPCWLSSLCTFVCAMQFTHYTTSVHLSKFLQVTLVLTTIWRIRQELYPLPPGNSSTLYSSLHSVVNRCPAFSSLWRPSYHRTLSGLFALLGSQWWNDPSVSCKTAESLLIIYCIMKTSGNTSP